MTKLNVIVVGGGIGGCAAALALTRAGHDVEVFERAAFHAEVGAGIQISPNASRLLHRYGLASALEAVAVKPGALVARRWDDGQLLAREELGPEMMEAFGAPHYHLHRADLLRTICAAIPPGRLHLEKRCIRIVDDGNRVRAEFEDGSTAEGDVIVGADGIHSMVRQHLHGEQPARFSHNIAFRGLAPAEKVAGLGLHRDVTNWMGPGGHFVHYFVSSGQYLNFVAVSEQSEWTGESWNDQADVAEIRERFSGWHHQVRTILDATETPFKWALFDRAPLPWWSKGRITLLGDACHPMLPYMAQGAAQAIEDGATLARCLSEHCGTVEDALAKYERIRMPRTTDVQSRSRKNARIFHLPDGADQKARDARMAARGRKKKKSPEMASRSDIFAYDAERI